MTLRAKSKTACAIARIDPFRLNEAIHAGFYPCAPETRPGSSRVYDVDQIVSLRIYGALLSLSLSAERAGHIACNAYSQYSGRDDVALMIYRNLSNGDWDMVAVTESDVPDGLPRIGCPRVGLIFDIPDLRKEITAHLEHERDNLIVGED